MTPPLLPCLFRDRKTCKELFNVAALLYFCHYYTKTPNLIFMIASSVSIITLSAWCMLYLACMLHFMNRSLSENGRKQELE